MELQRNSGPKFVISRILVGNIWNSFDVAKLRKVIFALLLHILFPGGIFRTSSSYKIHQSTGQRVPKVDIKWTETYWKISQNW